MYDTWYDDGYDYLMHYGVKGMKWGHRKNVYDVNAAYYNKRAGKLDARARKNRTMANMNKRAASTSSGLISKATSANAKYYQKRADKLSAKADRNRTMASMNANASKQKQAKKEARQKQALKIGEDVAAKFAKAGNTVATKTKSTVDKAKPVIQDHTGVKNHVDKKDFRDRRKKVSKSRTVGAKLATNLLAGPFANRTYNSVIAAGGSKAGAIGVTAATAVVGGPIGHLVVSAVYTNNASEKTYRNK